jgi:2-dehydro-3-deoxyphosphooctonate aldolase (KDO 8-P synthase)
VATSFEAPYTRPIQIGSATLGGGHPFVLIAGPPAWKGAEDAIRLAEELAALTQKLEVPFIFRIRSVSPDRSSFEGALAVIREVRQRFGVPASIDVREIRQVAPAAEAVNLLQIPSDLSRQTDLLLEAARTGRPVNIEKGSFLAPWDAVNALEKVAGAGNWNVMLTEVGTSFGYDRLVVDFRGFPILRESGFPLIFDSSHPLGAAGPDARPERRLGTGLCEAALAAGVDGLALAIGGEISESPEACGVLCPIEALPRLLNRLKAIDRVVNSA